MKNIAVILSGGTGSRLWPVSTEKDPKQFKSLTGEETMIEDTLDLLMELYDKESIFINTFEKYEKKVKNLLPFISDEKLILEPFGRNTAPAIALCEAVLRGSYDDNDVITFFPSDHVIKSKEQFFESIKLSVEAAEKTDGICSIGITPTRPDNQLGYIQYDNNNFEDKELFERGLRKAVVFAEKPDTETAQRFIESGDFVWNTGIFSVKFEVLREELKKHIPQLYNQITKVTDIQGKKNFQENLEFLYKQINSISIDYGLLEKTEKLYIVKSDFSWSDLSTWDEFYRLSQKDENNNLISGNVIALGTKNSLLKAEKKLITASGVEDLIVIETESTIFICKKGESEKVKDLINYIRTNEIKRLL